MSLKTWNISERAQQFPENNTHEIRVENIEFVALYNLGGRVIGADSSLATIVRHESVNSLIMGLVIFAPLISCVYPIEEPRLPWPIPVTPVVRRGHFQTGI